MRFLLILLSSVAIVAAAGTPSPPPEPGSSVTSDTHPLVRRPSIPHDYNAPADHNEAVTFHRGQIAHHTEAIKAITIAKDKNVRRLGRTPESDSKAVARLNEFVAHYGHKIAEHEKHIKYHTQQEARSRQPPDPAIVSSDPRYAP